MATGEERRRLYEAAQQDMEAGRWDDAQATGSLWTRAQQTDT
jgi:hypothetical protein